MPISRDILNRLEKNDPTLNSLQLSNENLDNNDIVELARALRNNTCVRSLNLSFNYYLSDLAAQVLADLLYKNTTIISLNLGWTTIGDPGAKSFADMLCKNKTLTSLDLNNCTKIGDPGASALAGMLLQNCTLVSLDLSKIQISETRFKALVDTLLKNKNSALSSFMFCWNKIGVPGLKALADMLSKTTSITSLWVSWVGVDDAVATKILTDAVLKNSTLTSLRLFNGKSFDEINNSDVIQQKLAKNQALAKNKEIKSNPISMQSVTPQLEEKKSIPTPSEPRRNTQNSSTQESQSLVGSFFGTIGSVGGWLVKKAWGQTNTFDDETIKKLQKLADEIDAATNKRLVEVEQAMAELDKNALREFKGKSEETRLAMEQATDQRHANAELEYIEADSNQALCEYYYVLRSQILHMWLAFQVVHTPVVNNDSKTKLDYLAEQIDKLGKHFPGLSLLTGFIKGAASAWSYQQKQNAVNHMAGLFRGLVEGDMLIDTLARQLTLAQEVTIRKVLLASKDGRFRKMLEGFKKVKNWALVNDVDTATKEFAAKHATLILENIMTGKATLPCKKKDLSILFSIVMGQNATYSPLRALIPNTQSRNGSSKSSEKKSETYSMISTNLSQAPKKDQLSELKHTFEEKDKTIKEMQVTLSRIQQQHLDSKDSVVSKRDFQQLQNELTHLKAQNQQKSPTVQREDLNALYRKIQNLEDNIGQNHVQNGGTQLQLQRTTNSSETTNSEQIRIAALEKQVSLLTEELQVLREHQSNSLDYQVPNNPGVTCVVS